MNFPFKYLQVTSTEKCGYTQNTSTSDVT